MIRALIKRMPGVKRMYFSLLYVRSAWQNRKQMKMLASLAAHGQKYVKEVEEIKQDALLGILRYAQSHTVYYQKLIPEEITRDNVDEIMERIPVLTRKDILEHGDELRSDEFDRMPRICMSTSGTTGVPLKFYRCGDYEFSHQNFLYRYITNNECCSHDYNKIVTFGGCFIEESDRHRRIFWKEEDGLYGCCLFSCFYLSEENLPFYIAEMEKRKPKFIRSYPSALLLFVELCKRTGARVNLDVKGIYVTSENATQDGMRVLSDFFHAPVHGQYGHSEACMFGFTKNCETEYYCSDLYGFAQVVDAAGHQVNVGETGRVVATSYLNKAMPFIKYETGDLAVYGGHKNGMTVLTQLIGRTQDYVLNAEGEKLYIIVGQLSECFLPAINHVMHWQAIQNAIGRMRLKIVKKETYTQQDEEAIFAAMKANKVITSFEYVDDIPLTKAGKRKYIIQNLPA